MSGTVYVVHCVDTEGPLYESLEATFERLEYIFDIDLEPTEENLRKIQQGELDLDGKETAVQEAFDPELLDYNEHWGEINEMLDHVLSEEFRTQYPDSDGNPWVYNWFCLDHVGYELNPRRRTLGYHEIFDQYRRKLDGSCSSCDSIQFHYHPHAFRSDAHRCATHWWANSDTLYQVLSRRIIDRNWFPAASRPGFQVNRPDSHWFLEQFIPFDFANLAKESSKTDEQQLDFSGGRSGDWRRAPRTWEPYHPDHDDYQSRGDCRRWIARCLNVGTRSYLLTETEVRQAFREASAGKPVVLAFADHDYRDIRADVEEVYTLLSDVATEFEDVEFEYSTAVDAMRNALELPEQEPCRLELSVSQHGDHADILTVETNVPTFGPQPYLALKTTTDDYYHDNFDFQEPKHKWTYVFDRETFPLSAIEKIGVAANNAVGMTTVATIDVDSMDINKEHWNVPSGNQ